MDRVTNTFPLETLNKDSISNTVSLICEQIFHLINLLLLALKPSIQTLNIYYEVKIQICFNWLESYN